MTDQNENGKGGEKLADAVEATLSETQRNAAQQAAMREMQIRAMRAEQRKSFAAIILNGMCAGVYAKLLTGEVDPGFGDRLVSDALKFADRLMEQADKPSSAGNA
jgi:hypothetical protein